MRLIIDTLIAILTGIGFIIFMSTLYLIASCYKPY